MAAGGTVLTRATQNGILTANPALLPYGAKNFRWLGMRTSLYPGVTSVNLIQSLQSGLGGGGGSEEGGSEVQEFLDSAFDTPLHFGFSETFSFISNHVGVGAFASTEPDIRAWKKGDPEFGAGTPSLVVRSETYSGALLSLAGRTFPWLSLGLTTKYLIVDEKREAIEVTDKAAIAEAKEKLVSQGFAKARGYGTDLGSLAFFQGKFFDLRLGATVGNAGGVRLSGEDAPELKQHYNLGLGLTFHGTSSAIHLAADYRDLTNVYEEESFKRLHLGARLLLLQFLGLAIGVYHGHPTYGMELDLFLVKLSASVYTREYGAHPGVDSRQIYILSFAFGTYF